MRRAERTLEQHPRIARGIRQKREGNLLTNPLGPRFITQIIDPGIAQQSFGFDRRCGGNECQNRAPSRRRRRKPEEVRPPEIRGRGRKRLIHACKPPGGQDTT